MSEIIEKLKELQKEYILYSNEYKDLYLSDDIYMKNVQKQSLLSRIQEIESVFRNLNININDKL